MDGLNETKWTYFFLTSPFFSPPSNVCPNPDSSTQPSILCISLCHSSLALSCSRAYFNTSRTFNHPNSHLHPNDSCSNINSRCHLLKSSRTRLITSVSRPSTVDEEKVCNISKFSHQSALAPQVQQRKFDMMSHYQRIVQRTTPDLVVRESK
jgi:hypothetical protein